MLYDSGANMVVSTANIGRSPVVDDLHESGARHWSTAWADGEGDAGDGLRQAEASANKRKAERTQPSALFIRFW